MMNGKLQQWMQILVCMLIVLKADSYFVDITYVHSAVAKGAVCLDGSPPAYNFDKGFGAGINNWLVHIEGGAWCENVKACLARKTTALGSSKLMIKQIAFEGILSKKRKFNPDFHKWNRIKIRYCDGASFTGDIETVDPKTNLHFRGARIFAAVMEHLLAKGMKNAKNAILSGCSAGGLTSILHCDKFKSFFPSGTKVKCLSDAGFFINARDISGAPYIEDFYNDVVTTHGSAKNLPQSCTSKMKPSLCFFPQNAAQGIQTPLFLVNSAYDSWQIMNILAPDVADPHGRWCNCKTHISKCSTAQLQILQEYRSQFINALTGLEPSTSSGYFINSCYIHCQTELQETWFRDNSPVLNNKTIAKAVGNWFYNGSPFQKIDCPYPCDKSCDNRVYNPEGLINVGSLWQWGHSDS